MKCGCCGPETVAPTPPKKTTLPPFLGVRLTWELLTASGSQPVWSEFGPANVDDDTRAFTLNGGVRLTSHTAGSQAAIGQVAASLGYIRVRFAAGAYDAPPFIQNLASNAVLAEQAVPAGIVTWVIAPGVVATPSQLPSTMTGLSLQLDSQGQITSLAFVDDSTIPQFRVLAYTPATAALPGSLSIEAVAVGLGDGTPMQKFQLQQTPVQQKSFQLVTLENGQWSTWTVHPDFDASGRASRDNVQATLSLRNPISATGGAAAETLDHTIGRAIDFLGRPQRAVTLTDCETLAKEAPGVDVARATAWANAHPSFPCLEAPGVITVVVLPNMPVAQPKPSRALLDSVRAYLDRRRIIGSRIEV